jgi:acetyl esterase/lipase
MPLAIACGLLLACVQALASETEQANARAPSAANANAAPRLVEPRRAEAKLGPSLVEHLDLPYAQYGDRTLKLDLFRLKQSATSLPGVVIVHGGGWINGDKTKFRALAQRLAERGYVTAAIEYRLAGEAKFPAAIHDCNAAVRWLRANAKSYGIDPAHIGAVGGSAGGHLVGLMAAAPQLAELQGDGGNAGVSSQLQAAVVMAGPLELATGPVAERSRKQPEQSNTNRWLGKTVDQAPQLYRLASPLTHLSPSTPPMLFMHGEFDSPQQNAASRKRLRELGVLAELKVYREGKHGCWNQHPWFDVMLDDIDAFFTPILTRHNPSEGKPAATVRRTYKLDRMPDDYRLQMARMNNPIQAMYARVAEKQIPLTLSVEPQAWTVKLPAHLPRATSAEVVIELVGRPYSFPLPRIAVADPQSIVTLPAHDAVTHGQSLRYEPQPQKNTLGYWTEVDDWCQWFLYAEQAGKYRLEILQGCGQGQGGSEVVVRVGDEQLTFVVEDTGHFQNFKAREVGVLAIPGPGVYSLELRPRSKKAKAVMDVRQVRLLPAES